MAPPRVLISYSHDSEPHRQRVLELAQRLRRDGIDAWIDQFEPAPPQGWPRWMVDEIAKADFVVLVCTDSYRRRFEGEEADGQGRGTTWEGMLLTQLMYFEKLNHETVIPVRFGDSSDAAVPTLVRAGNVHVLPRDYEALYKQLTRTLGVVPKPLGIPRGVVGERYGMPTVPELGDRLAALYEEVEMSTRTGKETRDLHEAILELRRKLRNGPELQAGDILAGRYALREKLGSGGFAAVWKCWDRKRWQYVAVKVLHGQWAGDRSRVERFRSGAFKMKSLRHPGIVEVLDDPTSDEHHHFFVMRWMGGGDLRNAVIGGQIGRQRALEAVAQALEGLMFAHRARLIHRDVKPDNILLDEEGNGVISDFDLVRDLNSTAGTRTGAGMGTFVYAAPEVLSDAREAEIERTSMGPGCVYCSYCLGRIRRH